MVMYFRNLLLKYPPVCGCHGVSAAQHTGHLPSAYPVNRKIMFVSYFIADMMFHFKSTSSFEMFLKCLPVLKLFASFLCECGQKIFAKLFYRVRVSTNYWYELNRRCNFQNVLPLYKQFVQCYSTEYGQQPRLWLISSGLQLLPLPRNPWTSLLS